MTLRERLLDAARDRYAERGYDAGESAALDVASDLREGGRIALDWLLDKVWASAHYQPFVYASDINEALAELDAKPEGT